MSYNKYCYVGPGFLLDTSLLKNKIKINGCEIHGESKENFCGICGNKNKEIEVDIDFDMEDSPLSIMSGLSYIKLNGGNYIFCSSKIKDVNCNCAINITPELMESQINDFKSIVEKHKDTLSGYSIEIKYFTVFYGC